MGYLEAKLYFDNRRIMRAAVSNYTASDAGMRGENRFLQTTQSKIQG